MTIEEQIVAALAWSDIAKERNVKEVRELAEGLCNLIQRYIDREIIGPDHELGTVDFEQRYHQYQNELREVQRAALQEGFRRPVTE